MKKEVVATIYLKSGNKINIEDDFDEINPTKTLGYFEKVISRIKDISTLSPDKVVGFFRYGGVMVILNQIEAVAVSDNLYRECGIVCASHTDEYNRNISINTYASDKVPATAGDYTEGLIDLND